MVGGGGFVGSAVMAALSAARLAPVAAGRRAVAGGRSRVCDAAEYASLAAACAGASAIVNAAAGQPAAMLRVTETVCRVAAEGGLPVVHVSSMAVYGAAEGRVDETAALDAGGSAYGAGKIACEARVRRFMAEGGTASILRPGIVYGPGDQQWIGRLCRLLRAGRLGDLGAAGDGFCNLIHAADVGGAAAACLGAPGGVFNLGSRAPPRWNDVLVRLALAVGAVPVRRIGGRWLALERRVLAAPLQVAKLAGARAGLAPGRVAEPIPASLLALFGRQIRLDPAQADTLGFARTDDWRGLDAAAAWFVEHAGR